MVERTTVIIPANPDPTMLRQRHEQIQSFATDGFRVERVDVGSGFTLVSMVKGDTPTVTFGYFDAKSNSMNPPCTFTDAIGKAVTGDQGEYLLLSPD